MTWLLAFWAELPLIVQLGVKIVAIIGPLMVAVAY